MAHTGSKEARISFNKEKGYYDVYVKSKPQDNKANLEIIKLFSRAFKKKARLVYGLKSKEKVIELP